MGGEDEEEEEEEPVLASYGFTCTFMLTLRWDFVGCKAPYSATDMHVCSHLAGEWPGIPTTSSLQSVFLLRVHTC